jgi:hypothetical protein
VSLSAFSAAQIVKAYAERAGLDPMQFAGVQASSPARQSRAPRCSSVQDDGGEPASVDTLRGYVRRADLFHEHAGAAFL